MSSMYRIGIIKGNTVYKPKEVSGTTASCISKILEESDIDIYNNFNYFNDDSLNPLFYKLTKEDREIIDTPFVDDTGVCSEIEDYEFPLYCDGQILKNGDSYHIQKLKSINYHSFHIIKDLSYKNLDKILNNIQSWQSNKKSDFFIKEIRSMYRIISEWILNEENIYWWQYL